jgi:hypothetical protein
MLPQLLEPELLRLLWLLFGAALVGHGAAMGLAELVVQGPPTAHTF